MKARVIATGEIVEVYQYGKPYYIEYVDEKVGRVFHPEELDFLDEPDYWTRLEHQYAGMAMQGMLANPAFWKMDWSNNDTSYVDLITMRARSHALALVEKLKEKEERK